MKKIIIYIFIIIYCVSCKSISTSPASLNYNSLPQSEKVVYERLYEWYLSKVFVEIQKQTGGVRFLTVEEYKSWESGMAFRASRKAIGAAMSNAAAGGSTVSSRNVYNYNSRPIADGSDTNANIREYYRTILQTAKQFAENNFDEYYNELILRSDSLIEEEIFIESMNIHLKYSLSNSLDDLEVAIALRVGIIIDLKVINWWPNNELSINVKDIMNNNNVNYSIATFIEKNQIVIIANRRIEDRWFSYGLSIK